MAQHDSEYSIGPWVILTGIIGFIGFFLFWLLCLNHLAPNEFGVAYNSMNGEVSVQDEPGWHLTSPMVRVATIDTRPFQVCMGGSRILNCKLIRFKKEGVKEFVRVQGFEYWSHPQQMCSNIGSEQQRCSGLAATLMGYAYTDPNVPFLEVIEEMKAVSK